MAKKKISKNDIIKEMNGFFKRYQPAVKKTGEQVAKALKAAEKDVAIMYKTAQTHVEIQLKNIEKEKIYHELGKYVGEKMMKGEIQVPELDKFKKKLAKIKTASDKKKKSLTKGETKKKITAKKNSSKKK